VWDKVEEVLKNTSGICKCEKCKADIIAYALNNLKPRYVVSYKGETFARAEFIGQDHNINITVEVVKAVSVVSSQPRHMKE